MGVLDIFLICVLEICDWCPGDILLVLSVYLIGFLEIFDCVLEMFDRCPGDI